MFFRAHPVLFVVLCMVVFSTKPTFGQDYYAGGAARPMRSPLNSSCNCVEITPNEFNRAGRVYGLDKINLLADFNLEFDFYLGNQDGGADGMVLFLHNDPRGYDAVGTFGEGLGYGPRPDNSTRITPSFGVEIDTWQNGSPVNDPSQDHISLLKNGFNWHSNTPNFTQTFPTVTLPNIEDGQLHRVRFSYTFATKTINIFFDGVLRITRVDDIAAYFGTNDAFWGVTGGTGGARNQHYFCNPNGLLSMAYITVTTPLDLCLNQLANMTGNTGSDDPANFDFQWLRDGNPVTGATNITHITDVPGVYTLQMTGRSTSLANGCVYTTRPQTIVANNVLPPAIPSALLVGGGSSCGVSSGSFTLTTTGGTEGSYRWYRDLGAGVIVPIAGVTGSQYTTPTLTVNTTFYVSVTNGLCESIRVPFTIVFNNGTPATPGAINSNLASVCQNGVINFSVTPVANTSFYDWQIPAGATYVSGFGTNNIFVKMGTSTPTGTQNVQVRTTNSCGSSSFTSTTTQVLALPVKPTISANGATIFCEGGQVTLTSTTASSYLWSNGATTRSIVVNLSGTYSVQTFNVNACGSLSSDPINITVNPLPGTPILTSDKIGNQICNGESITFTANAAGAAFYNFRVDGVIVQSGVSNQFITSSLTNGQQISVDVLSSTFCQRSAAPIGITVNPVISPTVNISGNLNLICDNTPVQFTSNVTNTGGFAMQYQWRINGQNIAGATQTTFSFNNFRNGDLVSLVVTPTGAVCNRVVESAPFPIAVASFPSPTLRLTTNQPSNSNILVNEYDTLVFQAQLDLVIGQTAAQYRWLRNNNYITGENGQTLTTTKIKDGDVIMAEVVYSTICFNNLVARSVAIPVAVRTRFVSDADIRKLIIYPNPSTGVYNIDTQAIQMDQIFVEVINNYGQTVYQVAKDKQSNVFQIDLSNQPAGIYQVKILAGQQVIFSQLVKL
ncbi:MAG TPA: hypothetical protein DCM08_11485 [Microscillaceae bacterium]|nr:hypothetical protein [Microscillaceae bacterium]